MTLIVEDGTGLANAESYDSVANIVATLTLTGEQAAYAAKTLTEQEQIARKAMRGLDSEWRYRGIKVGTTQALEWPRLDARDDDGYAYESNMIPTKLKQALAQLCAEGSVTGVDLQPNQSSPGGIKSESVEIFEAVKKSTEYATVKSQSIFYRKVVGLLAELIESELVLERA